MRNDLVGAPGPVGFLAVLLTLDVADHRVHAVELERADLAIVGLLLAFPQDFGLDAAGVLHSRHAVKLRRESHGLHHGQVLGVLYRRRRGTSASSSPRDTVGGQRKVFAVWPRVPITVVPRGRGGRRGSGDRVVVPAATAAAGAIGSLRRIPFRFDLKL